MDAKIINFQNHGDSDAKLTVAEFKKEIPFVVKRVYYLYSVKNNVIRGKHCHKRLQQLYIPIAGSFKVKLDDGNHIKTILLNNPNKALYIGKNIWREIYDFSKNGILLVLASDVYHETDYIRNHKNFLKYIKGM